MVSGDYLAKLLVAKTAQGEVNFAGRCVGYCNAPTVVIQDSNGMQHSWRADLCEILPIDEHVAELILPLKSDK